MKDRNFDTRTDAPSYEGERKGTHGSLAILLTAIVVAAVILLNVGFYAFATKNRWYIDMTKDKLFTLSDEVKEILEPVTADEIGRAHV